MNRTSAPWEDIEEDTTLINKLTWWLAHETPTGMARIEDAAEHFGVETIRIVQAATDGQWLGFETHDGVKYVVADGD